MALPRFRKLPAERRRALIAAAAQELAAKGYKGAVLGAIAERSGIGTSSFYYYFADKADLCATVLDEALQQLTLRQRIDLSELTAETFWPRFEAAVRENVELCHREPWLLAAARFLNRASSDPEDEAALADYRERRRDWEEAWIARGQDLGVIRSDVPRDLLVEVSLGARQASNLWCLERVEELGGKAMEVAFDSFELIRSLLSAPATTASGSGPPVEEPDSALPRR